MKQKPVPQDFSRLFLRLTAGVTLGIGIVLLGWPAQILGWFIPDANSDFFVRFIGSALLGYATLNYLAAEADAQMRRVTIIANLVSLTVASVLSIVGVVNRIITANQWFIIAEHLLFLVGFSVAYHKTKPRG